MSRSISFVRFSLFVFLVSSASTLLPAGLSRAQEVQGCFMVNGRGELVDLSALCPQPQPFNPVSTTASQSSGSFSLTPEQQTQGLDASATSYADAYCEARAQGLTHRQAGNQATSAAADYILSSGLSADDLSLEWYQSAESKSELLCPDLQPTTRYD